VYSSFFSFIDKRRKKKKIQPLTPILCLVYGEKIFGPDVWNHFVKETGIFADYFIVFDKFFLTYGDSDPFQFFHEEPRNHFLTRALTTVLDQWPADLPTWGKIRQVKMKNIFFDGSLPLSFGFDHIYEQPGNGATPWQGALYRSKGRQVTFSPSWRAVFDMGRKEVETALPGGPSGNRFSKYYKTGIQDWLDGKYHKTALK
jgi:penicillin amidase